MYVKFNGLEVIYEAECYSDDSTAIVGFTFKNIDSIQGLTNTLQTEECMKTINVYTDAECSVLKSTYSDYILSNINVDFPSGLLFANIKPADLVPTVAALKQKLEVADGTIATLTDDITTLSKIVNPDPVDTETLTLEETRDYQWKIVNEECMNTIYAGVDVETSQGIEHFSLTNEDQLNISARLVSINSGAAEVSYHSDGNLCRMFTAEEITVLAGTADYFKTRCLTICNHLHVWINRSEDKNEILNIHFNSTLPDDLNENLIEIMNRSLVDNTTEDEEETDTTPVEEETTTTEDVPVEETVEEDVADNATEPTEEDNTEATGE